MARSESNAGDSGKQRPQGRSSFPSGSHRGDSGTRSGDGNSRELPPQLGRYRVKEKLGGGGMGSVYLVENTELEREEALKVPHFGDGTDTELLERFLREARSAAKLDHANLCPIYDAGVQDGFYYLTMRYLKGKLLSDYSGQAQPTRKVVEIVAKLAQALETAHAKGVIHRDLKPSNIMMVAGIGPVVMDFGLAKQVKQMDTRLTQAGSMLGTPAYMPPEQVNGELDQMGPPSDVYSLGVIFYELLTGRLPFEGTVASIFGKILYTEAPLPSKIVPGLNPALDGICRKAMAKASSDRYPSMKAFAAVLIEYLKAMPATEGLGSLVPTAGDKADVFQAQTVAPSPRPAPRPDLFQAQTVAPQSRGSLPLATVGPSESRNSGGMLETVAVSSNGRDIEDGARAGASFGTKLVRMFVVTVVLGALAGVGWMMLPASKAPEPNSKAVAKASPRKSDPPPQPKLTPGPQPKNTPGTQPKNTTPRKPSTPTPPTPPVRGRRGVFPTGPPHETVLVPREVTQPGPIVLDNFEFRVVSCLQQSDGMECTLQVKDLIGNRAIKTQNGGNASAIFANGKQVRQVAMRIGDKTGYALFQGVQLFKDVALEIKVSFRNVPLNSPKIVLLDLGLWNPRQVHLRALVIQQVVEVGAAPPVAGLPERLADQPRELPTPEPLDPGPAEPRAADTKVADRLDGFVPLFDGNDFAGWHVDGGRGEAWKVESGEIVAQGQGYATRNYLMTDREYSDFILRLEFSLEKGVSSGIAIRAQPGEQLPVPGSGRIFDHPLIKLVESPGREQTGTTHWVGNAMNVNPGQSAALKPVGSWNLLEVEVKGRALRAWVNEKPVLNTTIAPEARFSDGTVPALNRPKGQIGLQRHTRTVRFRNIQLKDLGAAPQAASNASNLAAKAASSLAFGQYLEQTGKHDEALRLYQDIVRDYPNTPSAEKAKENIAAMTGKAKKK